MSYRLTRQAGANLVAIVKYTASVFGEAQARKYQNTLVKAFQRIGDNPLFPESRTRKDLQPGVRVLRVEKHLIVFRQNAGVTEIMRIPS
ncbi:toxin ParE1/3/4 [Nitrospirillum amazonense]|uniref:Toxin ParE1/3/4 n=1 Tax=Nitrospirillum amazonense TaxID=28077 RepID=A0A560FM22_9PROT|nr:type II toxin-antitoxin system RelE/ParE family toxin [Nitrospirillum amazonense]TWB22652.1 toxin ParE1/3/4 [Nitrospirillum amazonense]